VRRVWTWWEENGAEVVYKESFRTPSRREFPKSYHLTSIVRTRKKRGRAHPKCYKSYAICSARTLLGERREIQHKAFPAGELTKTVARIYWGQLPWQWTPAPSRSFPPRRKSSHATIMQTTTLLHPDIRLTPDPVSTPEKFRSGHGHLELTPVWQYVIKKNKFPTNVDRQEVISELAVRLQHPEWQVSVYDIHCIYMSYGVVLYYNKAGSQIVKEETRRDWVPLRFVFWICTFFKLWWWCRVKMYWGRNYFVNLQNTFTIFVPI